MIIGIDIGNSNCSVSYRTSEDDNRQTKMLAIAEPMIRKIDFYKKNVLRTAVFFPEEGEPIVGTRAVACDQSDGILFINFKQQLLEEHELKPDVIGHVSKTAQDALTEIFRFIARNALDSFDLTHYFTEKDGIVRPIEPPNINIGHPSKSCDIYKTRLLKSLVDSAWFSDIENADKYVAFIPEPVAPVLNAKVPPNLEARNWFVFDHGGLTLDLALVVADGDAAPPYTVENKMRVEHEVGGRPHDVGGSVLDRLLLHYLISREGGIKEFGHHIYEAYEVDCDLDKLEALISFTDEAIVDSRNEREVYNLLMLDVENLRVSLSKRDHVEFDLNTTSEYVHNTGIELSKYDFETEVLEGILGSIRKATDEICKGYDDIYCITAGGTSLTPSIYSVISQRFGGRALAPRDYTPLEIIAAGLARFCPDDLEEWIGDITDTEYGIWTVSKGWTVVVPEGTAYRDTKLPSDGLPQDGEGFYRDYRRSGNGVSEYIKLRVGQNMGNGQGWRELGMRRIRIPNPRIVLRIYLEVDPQKGVLEARIMDKKASRLLPFNNPHFETNEAI